MKELIAAHGANYLIGSRKSSNGLPWPSLKEDMAFFRRTTMGRNVVMGRYTWELLPDRFRPLPGRDNFVLTYDKNFVAPGATVFNSIHDLLSVVEDPIFIGGKEIYHAVMQVVDRMYLTSVYGSFDGEVYFPSFNPMNWQKIELERHPRSATNLHPFVIYRYDRLEVPQETLLRRAQKVEIAHARSDDQRIALERIAAKGDCPFCPDFFQGEHPQPILHTGKYWYLTPSRWPYGDGLLRVHMMAISIQHVEKLSDLPREARVELIDLAAMVEENFGIESGAVIMRFGKLGYNGSSVDHLHAHITCGDYDNPFFETVRFKIATLPKDQYS